MRLVSDGLVAASLESVAGSPESGVPLVAVVVLNYNGWPLLEKCLESVRRLDYAALEVIVVDNGSADGSAEKAGAREDLTVLRAGYNLGFSGGNNLGIVRALERGADYVWLLNNDTQADSGALASMVETAQSDPAVGIVGSVLYFTGGGIQAWGGGTVDWRLGAATRDLTKPGRVDYVAGASMLVRRKVFEDVGLLDPRYFLYMEDADFCVRAARNGWAIAVAAKSRIYHCLAASVGVSDGILPMAAEVHFARSSGIFIGKLAGLGAPMVAAVRLAGLVARRLQRRQARRVPKLAVAFVHGLAKGARSRRSGPLSAAPETACAVCNHPTAPAGYGGVAFRQCPTCGYAVVFAEASQADYWTSRQNDDPAVVEPFWLSAKKRLFRRVLGRLEAAGHGRRLLDIGGGLGFFAELALRRGWDAFSLDVSASANRAAGQRLGADRVIESLRQQKGSFDVVTLWCVVAHTKQPGSVVSLAAEALRPGGLLWLTTPNFAFQKPYAAIRRAFGKPVDFAGDDHVGHFSSAALTALLHQNGFESVQLHFEGITETCIAAGSSGKALVAAKRLWNAVAFGLTRAGGPNWMSELQVTALRKP